MAPARDSSSLLREAGLRATAARVALLNALCATHKPLKAAELRRSAGRGMDLVTVYRAMDALEKAGLAKRIGVDRTSASWEFAHRAHHHHLVCRGCGELEDVGECAVEGLEKRVLGKSKRFASVSDHSLEFFGTCRDCASAARAA
ncbi:hypothetical protein COU20_00365 [Candidatus Kaiserbacteria bacterium CG10_big_fil_rev_8_21_14_0_10_59_10]|uniref:Transcriptional repressor n=1 Tax=Candidatus Kaiserbacteria bacterium CG10_big_fil_rev_8_21_14_0_10_59_10 TaxID=1974612 RepID=A0A2H0U8S0_9BACT|nr:MAG: hypothetical protein COU20_00365 [Candidatus Kaiserbacteria bacterium CG10_big_fil_rev_8_21_14_0_10_59_10]